MNDFIKKVRNYLTEYKMLQKKDRVVVGVSGGADSVCLFFVLLELKAEYELELYLVHIHHGIRGEEADADQAFVEALGRQFDIPVISRKKEVKAYGKKHGLSEEEAGRQVRYRVFEEVCREYKCNKIAVAHNMNDNGETMLFHLARGSGVGGLCGIPPVRGEIIRPLLGVTRNEIEAYLKEQNQPFRTDATNLTDDYARNRIRHMVIPVLEELNEKAIDHMSKTAEMLRETEAFLEKAVKEASLRVVTRKKGQYLLEIEPFKDYDAVIQKGILRTLLFELAGQKKDIESVHVESLRKLMEMESGKRISLPYGLLGEKEYSRLLIKKQIATEKAEGYNIPIEKAGIYSIPGQEWYLEVDIVENTYKVNEIPKNDYTKWFDYDKICNTVHLRTRKNGDFLQIQKDGGTKKLKDYFMDEKISREEREQIPLLTDGPHVIWVIGKRISEMYKISEQTRQILRIKWIGGNQHE